jgi:hypothetical protein
MRVQHPSIAALNVQEVQCSRICRAKGSNAQQQLFVTAFEDGTHMW